MKFLFACGGTAGHINPALGIAGFIRELMPDAEILFVGAAGNMETELVPREGFEIVTVTITNIQRSLSPNKILHNLKTIKNVVSSGAEAAKIIRDFSPDVAIGTGGYVCYPVLRAAAKQGVPTVIHESNAVPGLTVRMLEGIVDRILVGFEGVKDNYRKSEKVTVTGTPVRQEFFRVDRAGARAELGIADDRPVVASLWGSLGADHMNEVVAELIKRLCRSGAFNLIHSASRGYDGMVKRLDESGYGNLAEKGIDLREYIYDMPRVMAAADLVLCRSGASTLSELAALGKPAILVPSPNVTADHQEENARVMENAGAARVMLEGSFNADSLLGEVSSLLSSPSELGAMADRMKTMGMPDATERIVNIILDLAGEKAL